MKIFITRLMLVMSLVVAVLVAPAASAATALSFTGGTPYTWPGASIGWEFSIAAPITITDLGVYDEGSDGLTDSHEVGIFPAGVNTAIVSTTVTSGDTLDNGFRYASISPVVLPAGSYVVAARMPTGSDRGTSFAAQATAPEISYTKEWFLYSGAFELPTDDWNADGGNFGANFKFNESAAVVPTQVPTMPLYGLALTTLGLLLMATRRLRLSFKRD